MQTVEARMRLCESYDIVGGISEDRWKSKVTNPSSGPFTVTFLCYLKNSASDRVKVKVRVEAVMVVKSTSSLETWTFVGTSQHGGDTHYVRGVLTPGLRILKGGFSCEFPDKQYHAPDSRLVPVLTWVAKS